MNKSVLLFLFSLMLFFGCTKEKEILGSGKVITDTREVPEFDRIFFSGTGNLYIKQIENEETKIEHEGITIEAEDNIASLFVTEVTDGTLHIYFKDVENTPSIRATLPINIYVKARKLQEIHLSGSGTISSQHLHIQTLKVSISGSGNTDLSVFGQKLICVLSGSGRFALKGAVEIQDIWLSGSGVYDAQNLTSKVANINVSGTGTVIVNVQDNINLRLSGAGIIYYKGNPKIAQTISGTGKIQQITENIKLTD